MKKLSVALLLLALVLAVVPAALAQDTLGASQTDFDAWVAANEATFSASSMSLDFSLSAGVTGMADEGGDVSVALTGSGVVIADPENPGLQLDVTGTATSSGEKTPITFGIRVVDGNVYVNDGSSWQSMTLEEASSMLGGLASSEGVPVDPSALASGDMSSMGDLSGMMEGFEDMKASDFLSLTRAGDTYTLSLDISALISSPAVAPLVAGSMGGSSGTEMTDAQIQQMAAMMGAMFSEATVDLTQNVEADMMTSTALDVNIPLDIVAPGAGVTLNFALNLGGFGDRYTIEVPEGATPMSS
ncbi:MAG: hypothetical protein IT319_01240 [Anaerolineae bacterium]|nr:hypothetical protein [Anaerolineae bacterium]